MTLDHNNTAQVGDTELWVLRGQGWRIPIYVNFRKLEGCDYATVAMIEPGLSLTPEILQHLHRRLVDVRLDSDERYVFISRFHLEKMAWKAPGVNPSYYLNLSVSDKEAEINPDEELPENEFLTFAALRTGVDLDQLTFYWEVICHNAMRWFMYQHKPLDFGYFKLYALPLRVDFPDRWWVSRLHHLRLEDVWKAMTQNIPTAFDFEQFLAVDPETLQLQWSLHVTPEEPWYDHMHDVAEWRNKTPTYANYARNILRSMQESISRILHSYGAQASIPTARIHCRGNIGTTMYGPNISPKSFSRSAWVRRQAAVLSFSPSRPYKRRPSPVAGATQSVQEVRRVRQTTQDMRERLQHILGRENAADGTDRVRVLSTTEERNTNELPTL